MTRNRVLSGWIAAALAIAALALGAEAQETSNRVDAKRDWSVFSSESNGKLCWIVTQPTSTVANRNGKPVSVRRGDIYLMVAVRPSANIKNEVSVVAGYPLEKGSTMSARIGANSYDLFTEGEGAWLSSAEEDNRMVSAMKRGRTAVITGRSQRGTTTVDTFSLLGFTDALETARKLCG